MKALIIITLIVTILFNGLSLLFDNIQIKNQEEILNRTKTIEIHLQK